MTRFFRNFQSFSYSGHIYLRTILLCCGRRVGWLVGKKIIGMVLVKIFVTLYLCFPLERIFFFYCCCLSCSSNMLLTNTQNVKFCSLPDLSPTTTLTAPFYPIVVTILSSFAFFHLILQPQRQQLLFIAARLLVQPLVFVYVEFLFWCGVNEGTIQQLTDITLLTVVVT